MSILKNISKTIAFVLSLTLLISCTNKASFKAGFLHPSKNRQRFVNEANLFAQKIKALGGEAIIDEANDNEFLQLEKGYKMLDEGVDILVIAAVNGNTIAPLVREAKKRGVTVIAYLRLINNADYDAFVTCDNVFMAETWCSAALSRFPKGNYVVIAGDRFDKNAEEEKVAVDAYLKPHIESGDIKLLFDGYMENWDRAAARNDVEQVFQAYGKNVDAIISFNDQMADGAIEVLKKYGLEGKVFTSGQDGDKVAVNNIKKGFQDITFFHPNKELGTRTAEVAYNVFMNASDKNNYVSMSYNGLTSIPTIRIKSVPITLRNLSIIDK